MSSFVFGKFAAELPRTKKAAAKQIRNLFCPAA
jgi:hypothetical protein